MLLSFLIYWNYNQYKAEVLQIENNAQLNFENVVREVEDELWQSKILGNITRIELKESNVRAIITNADKPKDSLVNFHDHGKREIFVGVIDTMLQNVSAQAKSYVELTGDADTTFKFRTNTNIFTIYEEDTIQENASQDFTGMMSLHVVTSKNEDDSSKARLVDSIMFNVVKPKLNNEGNAKFEIVKLTKLQDTTISAEIYTGKYTDIVTGDSYIGKVAGYEWVVIKTMWAQIAFSAFLFGITALAFFFVLRSLNDQGKLAALKNDFISNMTHELKTPITTVGVALEALSSFNALQDPKRTDEYIDISQKELSRLSMLVDKVLKMALFEKKEPELKLEQIDLKELLSEVVSSMKLHFEKFGGKYSLSFTGDNFNMEGDKVHLTSVIYNLIDNALKYSPDQPKVQISLHNHPDDLNLVVEDNGVGIGNAYIDKIFDKFFRVPSGDRHNIRGYGLGLSYVASVVHKHHGTIAVTSEMGKGSTFSVKLPRHHE